MNYVYLHFFFKSSKIFIRTAWQKHGQEELPLAQGAVAGRKRAERSYSMFKVKRSSCEEIPLVQGKEQRLHIAGAAVKRYPKSKRNPSRRNPGKMVGVARGIRGQTHKP